MRYKILTYGCQMNVHESEKIAGLLDGMGGVPAEEGESADVIVFNTCCIRDNAERRALGNIGVVKGEKKKHPDLIIAVCGCMTQQEGAAAVIRERYPYVDIVLGTRNIFLLPQEIEKVKAARAAIKKRSDKRYRAFETAYPEEYLSLDERTPVTRTSFPNAWVNIIYGCNNFCTYCIVPYVRGRELSRPMSSVLLRPRRGEKGGGRGLRRSDPPRAKRQFLRARPDGWGELRKAVARDRRDRGEIPRAFHDLPPQRSDRRSDRRHQSGSDKVLKDMNRRYTRERYLSLIEKLRAAMPDIGITTDVMVGFPTETEEDFLATTELVKTVRFSNAFTFVYSPRKGTPAAEMPQIPYAVKRRRIGELIKLQNSVTKELSEDYVGNVYEVLAEDVSPKHEGMLCGRTESGRLATFPASAERIGEFLKVRVTEARSASLFGRLED